VINRCYINDAAIGRVNKVHAAIGMIIPVSTRSLVMTNNRPNAQMPWTCCYSRCSSRVYLRRRPDRLAGARGTEPGI